MWYLENTYTVELHEEPEGKWQAWLYLNTTSLAGVDLVGPCPCPCLHCHYSNSWVSPSEIEKKGIYEDVQYLTFLRTYLEEIYSPVKHLLYNMLFLFSTHFFNFSVISRKMFELKKLNLGISPSNVPSFCRKLNSYCTHSWTRGFGKKESNKGRGKYFVKSKASGHIVLKIRVGTSR